VLRELRDPFLHALALREAHDREDDVDETLEADDAAQAERRRAALLTAGGRPPQGAARRAAGPALAAAGQAACRGWRPVPGALPSHHVASRAPTMHQGKAWCVEFYAACRGA